MATASKTGKLTWRGYLLHLTHYDPVWYARKAKEAPFDEKVAQRVLRAIAAQGFNLLLIGVSDGVRYRSHPELRRHYSRPMSMLRDLAAQARDLGMQVAPKLNFSRSEINTHNHWMRKAGQAWHEEFDDQPFWSKAFDCIDEVIDACKPERFFHVGMDEDHDRSHAQYVAAIQTLRVGLKQRGLRTIAWSDSAIDYASGEVYREKSLEAERAVPRDTVRLLWNYWMVPAREIVRIRRQGHELWGAPGGRTLEQAQGFRDELVRRGGKGLVMTHWIPCTKRNQGTLLSRIEQFGPLYAG